MWQGLQRKGIQSCLVGLNQLIMSYPGLITMTNEDKQLINGEKTGSKSKMGNHFWLSPKDSTNNLKPTPELCFQKVSGYFLVLSLHKDLPFIHLTNKH